MQSTETGRNEPDWEAYEPDDPKGFDLDWYDG